VVGAIYSGVAAVITAMAAFRWVYHLEEYIKPIHFINLGYLLLAIDLTYLYFTFNEYWVAFYGNKVEEMELLNELFIGTYAPLMWGIKVFCFFLPAFLIAIPKTRTVKGIVLASILANIGMWIKRYLIIVPVLARPLIPNGWGVYNPTWVEWSIIAGLFALFTLLYTLFSKTFPIIPIEEVREIEMGKNT
ncbi:MAG: NrfD/PsrC family molybdoenzyme membrane anchor subunit, partial [Nitrososphaerota archaeon]|nr:NrfD/PsrC family molybdoenzyme membrane anchor subunit [Nitrososphaerota archaeon]